MKPHKKMARLLIVIAFLSVMYASVLVFGAPVGPTFTVLNNSTISSTPASRTDAGGYIYFNTISATQQDYSWKAYVGNVTGMYTLDDANGKTIYDWSIDSSSLLGEVYATRNGSIVWTTITCANDTVVLNETQYFGFGLNESDNINLTFNESTHRPMVVGTNSIGQSSCRNTYTYVNNTRQAISTGASFQELLLADKEFNLIYATFIDKNKFNYQSGGVVSDFQMILPENKTHTTPTTYFFYVEIG